ncbi:unnamed protein product [Candidula unifasciata]|uniref:Uncharacterized protein n=1 Tax=Candidula unifasciata TaxID=100452 RepID=A0A8S3Z4U9_9EUPU|nr:unnamed protein product [Candidula unifasciata]
MKVTLLFLAVAFAVAYAQFNMVAHEVHAIIAANDGITVDECVKKCDDAFMLMVAKDETLNDHKCSQECDCQIKATCPHSMFRTTTQAD